MTTNSNFQISRCFLGVFLELEMVLLNRYLLLRHKF